MTFRHLHDAWAAELGHVPGPAPSQAVALDCPDCGHPIDRPPVGGWAPCPRSPCGGGVVFLVVSQTPPSGQAG